MEVIGHVESLWRYPVKSMRGHSLAEAFASFCGLYCYRLYAFQSTRAEPGSLYLPLREQAQMFLYRPRIRDPERMRRPRNLGEAEALPPGLKPLYAAPADTAVDVEIPDGGKLSIDDPGLLHRLSTGLRDRHELSLRRSDRSMTD